MLSNQTGDFPPILYESRRSDIGFEEPKTEVFASVYPKLFLALTALSNLVGLITCVVWS